MSDESLNFASVCEAMVSLGAQSQTTDRVAEMKQNFAERTGGFGPDDPWFEVRSRAFWDDVLTDSNFLKEIKDTLPAQARAWVEPFRRAHRGIFEVEPHHGRWVLRDLWNGADFVLLDVDDGLRDALDASAGLCDGRLVAKQDPIAIGILPGAVFHAAEATAAILQLLDVARQRAFQSNDLLDSLLRMDRTLRSLSRVKASFAYHAEALLRESSSPSRKAVTRSRANTTREIP